MPIDIPDSRTLPEVVLEALRMRAIRAKELGYSISTIAQLLGLARETVSRWCSAYNTGGTEAMPGRKSGRPIGSGRRLRQQQEDEIIKILSNQHPEDFEIPMALWTRPAVRELISRQFGIDLPVRTVGDYLKRWGLTPQRPTRKSYRQDPEEVRRWLEEEYPAIEARAAAENAEILWEDETGIGSNTYVGRGYAAPQHPPELRVSGDRFSINMASTVTNQGKVRWMLYEEALDSTQFIQFLTRLLDRSERKIFVIVDRLRVHNSADVQIWLYEHRDKIEIFGMPKYSPELNPDEYLNADLKQEVNKDGLPSSRQELKQKAQAAMQKLVHLPRRIANYFQHPKIQYAAYYK